MFGHQRGDSREGIGKKEREGRHPGDTLSLASPRPITAQNIISSSCMLTSNILELRH